MAMRTAGLPSGRLTVQAIGTVEILGALFTLGVAGRAGAAFVTLVYATFAGFSALLLRRSRGGVPCGCFGGDDSPVTSLHVWLNVVVAAITAWATVDPPSSIRAVAGDTPWAGIPFLLLVLLLAWLLLTAYTVLPAVLSTAKGHGRQDGGSIGSTAAATGSVVSEGLSITPRPEVRK